MEILIVVGYILAFINPVIGGVLVGYIVWSQKKLKKLEETVRDLQGKA